MKRYIKPQQQIIPVASEANLCAGSPIGMYDSEVNVQGAPTFNGSLDDEEE